MSAPVKVTEVSSRRGRRWVYGPLDPARLPEFRIAEPMNMKPETFNAIEEMIRLVHSNRPKARGTY